MATKYKLKDQEKFKKLCELFPRFEESFQKCCEKYFNDDAYIGVHVSNLESLYWCVTIPKEDIEVVEDLKPYVWYPSEKFDGNPNNYILVEDDESSVWEISACKGCGDAKLILHKTTRFMYLNH